MQQKRDGTASPYRFAPEHKGEALIHIKPHYRKTRYRSKISRTLQYLENELKLFAELIGPTNFTTLTEHSITLQHDRTLEQRYFSKNVAKQHIINEQVD